jgi:hypothetical protein
MLDRLRENRYEVQFLSHASAILSVDFPDAITELEDTLLDLTIPVEELIRSGGGITKGTQRLRTALEAKGWNKVNFTIEKRINGIERESRSHEVDHVKAFSNGSTIALEIEWNNKDPFFDRDLENFKRLHAEGAISVGVIITRGTSLQDALCDLVRQFAVAEGLTGLEKLQRFALTPTPRQKASIESQVQRGATFEDAWSSLFVADKYGAATTHWRKLEARVSRGVGNPCPLLLIGIPKDVVKFK